jgi:two-component system cell cycle sensor histidine kinase/response regulator CckA
VRSVTGKILEKLGFHVVEAVDQFERDPARFDLVLMDLTMPGMNGVDALRRMRERRPDLRVLLMSGYAESEAESRLAGTVRDGFLQKPFTVGSLIAKVRVIFDGPERVET